MPPPSNRSNLLNFFKQAVLIVIFFACCFFCAKFGLLGLGEKVHTRTVIVCALFLSVFVSSRKTYYGLILPLSLLVALYTPVGIFYGVPNFQAMISLLATDVSESYEFLSEIPAKNYLKALAVVLLAYFAHRLSLWGHIRPWRNKTFVLICIAALVVMYKPTKFVSHITNAWNQSEEAQKDLARYVSNSAWGQSFYNGPANKDYILVIGESVRRDYMQIYGYPVENTPFLAKAPATIVEGLSAGGTYTIGSLRLMLTLPIKQIWEPQYQFNMMDMVKSAGIRTVWVSNQGFIGRFDTPISSIGNRADKVIFPNLNDYSKTKLSDFALLKFLGAELSQHQQGPRFVVLHTIGSHPDACTKIDDLEEKFVTSDERYRYITCYINSIKKADEFIERLYNQMNAYRAKTGREFSIIYFADHGMVHDARSDNILLNNSRASKLHYSVPLLKIDSQASDSIFLRASKSGLRFTEGIATWIGIENENVKPYDLFDGVSDENDFGLQERIKKIDTPLDPAIDVRSTLKKVRAHEP